MNVIRMCNILTIASGKNFMGIGLNHMTICMWVFHTCLWAKFNLIFAL